MKKCLIIILITLTAHTGCFAQFSRYIVQLKDKASTPYTTSNPIQFLTQRSIDRRLRYNIPLDETDLPITPQYIESIQSAGNVTILNVSKWLNQVCIQTTDAAALAKINSFSFVIKSSPIAARQAAIIAPVNKQLDPAPPVVTNPVVGARPQGTNDIYDYGLAYPQIHMHNAEFLHNLGFRGEGMQLAIMDAGFYHYETLPTFDSVRNNNQVLGTWDFVANEKSVNEDFAHGMNCFSTIAANLPGSFVGTSPKSSYYLYRTEDINSEYPVEEQNFATAAERADSLGVDIFSVSLGYNQFDNSSFNYTYADMDGNTTIITRASDYAAKKGILLVVAAGNVGSSAWHYILAPADADSVLTVGAVNASKQVAGFSSYGPTADGRIKPDVAAIGQGAVVANQVTGDPSYNNGTSFACPIMAGIGTCLWQAFPEVNNMAIIDALRKSSDKINNPDDRTGYGIPDAKKAFVSLIKKLYNQQVSINNNCFTNINWTVKSAAAMSFLVERKLPGETSFSVLSTKQSTGFFKSANFSYSDDLTALPAGIPIQYRLKMNIGTDTSFYFDTASVNYLNACSNVTEKITISPNPVTDKLTVLVVRNNPTKVSVIIYTVTGQLIYKDTRQVNGAVSIAIPMKQLSKGVYLVTVYFDDKKQITRKIVR
ncbi:MAG: S8 family serine peptidase [Ferruginibacter sp.]